MGRQSNVGQLFHHHDSSHEPDKAARLIRVSWGSCVVIALVFLPQASSTVVAMQSSWSACDPGHCTYSTELTCCTLMLELKLYTMVRCILKCTTLSIFA